MPLLETPDAQTWGYARHGRQGGRPVLVHHGLMGNATLGPLWAELGEVHGLEWFMIERPGYGQTPPVAMERIADWPAMIAPLLDALGIKGGFDAVGMSAGAPYAYAMAAGMPERVERVGILSGVPFIGSRGVLAVYPEDGRAAYDRYAQTDETGLRAEFRAFCQAMAARFSDNTQIALAVSAILAHDAAGPAREARLQAIDWGFDQTDIQCPVDLWHSKGDDMVPFAAARLSADRLVDATWHTQAEPSHFASEMTLRHLARVLAV